MWKYKTMTMLLALTVLVYRKFPNALQVVEEMHLNAKSKQYRMEVCIKQAFLVHAKISDSIFF